MDCDFKFSNHASSVCQKCYAYLRDIFKLKHIFPFDVKLKLYESLIMLIVYDTVHLFMFLIELRLIYTLFRKYRSLLIRYCFNLNRTDNMPVYASQTGWLNIESF